MAKQRGGQRAAAKQFCEQATSLVGDYLDGELDPKTARNFEMHLAECPDCVAFLSTYKQTLRAGRALECEDMPPTMQKRVQEFLRRRLKDAPTDD